MPVLEALGGYVTTTAARARVAQELPAGDLTRRLVVEGHERVPSTERTLEDQVATALTRVGALVHELVARAELGPGY